MLLLTIPGQECWNTETEEFVTLKGWTLALEHSLVSLSKWEAKWNIPFLSEQQKTPEQIRDYVRFMTLTQNVDPEAYLHLTTAHYKQIQEYIDAPMTATWFSKEEKATRNHQQVTAELIYYWMITQNIPFECQKWHLNRLMTLIKVCSIQNQPKKKGNKREYLTQRAALNAARRKQLGSKG